MSAALATRGVSETAVAPSADERSAGTLRLPNSLAYVIAAFAVIAALSLPFAIAASGLSLTEAVDGYYVQNCVLFALLGVVILRRRPGHVIGWLLVAIGGLDALRHVATEYLLFGLHERPGWLSGEVVYALVGWTWVPAVAGLSIALPQFLPDGRLLSPRWRTLAVAGVVATVLLSVTDALLLFGVPDWLDSTALLLFGLLMLLSLVPLLVRFERSTGIERQQLKWIFLGLAITAPLMGIGVVGTIFGHNGAAFTIAPLVIMPVAITVAVVRYRLYDIDVLINKSVVFVVLAAFITGVYAVIVVGLGRLLPFGEGNLGLAIAATAVVAMAFEPVRARVQHWANRLVYGRRATPYEALATMTARIADSADPGAALGEAARLLAEGTGAAQTVIWVVEGGRLHPRGTAGSVLVERTPVPVLGADLPALPGADLAQAVRHEGQLVGALTLTKRPGEGVSSADRRLVEELAGQAALLLANTRLRSRLGDRVTELRESRQRMLAAQDRARRALERDLHDGAQQELVALKVKLGLARTIATREGATALAEELTSTALVADQAVDGLREIARGIYPPLLEAEGLPAALSAQARRADLAITVLDRAGRRYPREVEATAYFCAVEALQNAVRHAHAEHAHIELNGTDTSLIVTVTDDGAGFDADATTYGSGLTHMTDRVDSAGGSLTVNSRRGHGTTIELALPVPA